LSNPTQRTNEKETQRDSYSAKQSSPAAGRVLCDERTLPAGDDRSKYGGLNQDLMHHVDKHVQNQEREKSTRHQEASSKQRERKLNLTCKFHFGAYSILAIGIEHFGTGPYRCTIPDFIIIIICE
jgi:6-phosphogluconolactonase/glucosamine-6-phosphate isomerase/deaminase